LEPVAVDYAAAWTSKEPGAVTSFYAEDGQIQINGGEIMKGQAALKTMVEGLMTSRSLAATGATHWPLN
jgi:ketosteroid isomerase-like protein